MGLEPLTRSYASREIAVEEIASELGANPEQVGRILDAAWPHIPFEDPDALSERVAADVGVDADIAHGAVGRAWQSAVLKAAESERKRDQIAAAAIDGALSV